MTFSIVGQTLVDVDTAFRTDTVAGVTRQAGAVPRPGIVGANADFGGKTVAVVG